MHQSETSVAPAAAPAVATSLAYNLQDRSTKAVEWRSSPVVRAALDWLAGLPTHPAAFRFPGVNVKILVLGNTSGEPALGDLTERRLPLQQLALGFELAQGSVGLPQLLPAGFGSGWFGVDTQQDAVDAASLHKLLWREQPDLLIELGTWCGGSAIFFAKTMMMYNPSARVITVDLVSPEQRGRTCTGRSRHGIMGAASPHWKKLHASGSIVSLIGNVGERWVFQRLKREASRASRVMIIDDGDHLAPALTSHFHQLKDLVTVGSYYLIEDSRLDTDCAQIVLRHPKPWSYCTDILRLGGPATAIGRLTASASFGHDYHQDRSVEEWGLTQHPGGFFRRVFPKRAARRWLAGSTNGYCNTTTTSNTSDCASGESGAFSVDGASGALNNVTTLAQYCLAACAGCARCQFLTVSHRFADCSWYAACELEMLHTDLGRGFFSGRFREAGALVRTPSPKVEQPLF